MQYDYSKLTGKIVEVFGKQASFATAMGLSERSVSLKLNSQRLFKQNEISKAIELLGLSLSDIPEYFFTPKV
jgi:hypothetical protein